MAEWKAQVSYNYNSSYRAYAYGLVYQTGTEQNHGNLNSWAEAGAKDLSNSNAGLTQPYYATTARTREDSPPGINVTEQQAVNGQCQYRGSGVVYLGDTQAGCLLVAGPHPATYEAREHEARRTGGDSISDSEAHTSPDSWSSDMSREGVIPQADPATWMKKAFDNDESRSPDASDGVSSSLMEEPQSFSVTGAENTDTTSLYPPLSAPKKPLMTTASNPKGKVRAAFSESQLNALVQRFTVQRYLTPAEMKNLAEMTGLTYKQVKTWFQNRRMKLRRHQKDTNWVCERYTINKGNPIHGAMYSNIPSHFQPYQGEARPQLTEHYNQHIMEAAFRKTAPQNLAFYLAAVGGAAGSTGYPSWSSSTSQTAVSTRAQVAGWTMPTGVTHYEHNSNAFNPAAANNTSPDLSFDSKDGSL
uniref:Homeobox domain-containing protein n=1 Tax=Monopterus albus TaxID=43700 RepID=A0A3Q3Q1M5_MONAL|nr:homeobox protein vent1-like [Monopterus albus]